MSDSDIESDIKCLVCYVDMPKVRVHYGGISCYSCRAFFRRTTQKDDLVRCKFDRKCKVEHQERKSCPPCRYEKCLRAGMRPDLVLDEDDKKKRFKKFKVSKVAHEESDPESADEEVQIVQDISRKRKKTMDNIKVQTRRFKSSSNTVNDSLESQNSESNPPSLQDSVSPNLPWPQDDSDASNDQWATLPPDVIEDDENSENNCDGSFLDPATGEVVVIKESQSPCAIEAMEVPKVKIKDLKPLEEYAGKRHTVNDSEVETSMEKANEESQSKQEGTSKVKDSCTLPGGFTLSRIVQHPFSTQERQTRGKIIDDLAGEDRILKYIHKKFNKTDKNDTATNNPYLDTRHSIKKITIYNKSESEPHQQSSVISQPFRKSVIVKRKDVEPQIQIELHLKKEPLKEEPYRNQTNDFVVSLNIGDIENLFTIEEGMYFENVRAIFEQKWNAIPFGEEMMNHLIGFCRQRHNLPLRFFQLINNQLQERVLNFICSGDDLDKLPKSKQFSLLKRNLPEAVVLIKVLGFNMRTWTEEMDFVFTNLDNQQFKAQSYGVQGVKIDEILKYSPFPDVVKRSLLNIMHSCAHPILGDPSVFIMMLMLVIFTDAQDPDICSIHDQYWTMLKRHLTRRPDCCMGVDYLLSSINNCLRALPVMAQPFRHF